MIDYPVETLLDTRFIKVYDLQYAPGRHYYDATRRSAERLVAGMSDETFESMIPDAVSCCVVWHEEGRESRIVLNREYRYPLGQYVISVPAGLIDPEDEGADREAAICAAARREIQEETGIQLAQRDTIRVINSCLFSSPGLTDESNAMVRIDLYDHREAELTQDHAEKTEKFDGFLLADREMAGRLMRDGRISVYTWIGLAVFLSEAGTGA